MISMLPVDAKRILIHRSRTEVKRTNHEAFRVAIGELVGQMTSTGRVLCADLSIAVVEADGDLGEGAAPFRMAHVISIGRDLEESVD